MATHSWLRSKRKVIRFLSKSQVWLRKKSIVMSKSQFLSRFRNLSWSKWARNFNFHTTSSSPFSSHPRIRVSRKMTGHLNCKILRVNFTGRVGPVREARKRCLRCLPTSTTASPAMLCFRRSSGSNLSSNYRRRSPWIPLRKIRQRLWNRTSEVGPMYPSSLLASTKSRGISERKLIRSPLIYWKLPRLRS